MFELDAYCVNGHATQANASIAASRGPSEPPPPDEREPDDASRSQRIVVACAAGSVSHLPLQPKKR